MPSLFEIGQVVSEEDFLNFVNRFLLFHNYLCLEKGVALHLNKLESPLSKDALCQVWLKLHGPMVLKMKIFKFRQCFFCYLVIISPWKRTWSFM